MEPYNELHESYGDPTPRPTRPIPGKPARRQTVKTRRNIYMGQEYLDMEAIVVQERKRTGRDLSVADLVRKACREYVEGYWKGVAKTPGRSGEAEGTESV